MLRQELQEWGIKVNAPEFMTEEERAAEAAPAQVIEVENPPKKRGRKSNNVSENKRMNLSIRFYCRGRTHWLTETWARLGFFLAHRR